MERMLLTRMSFFDIFGALLREAVGRSEKAGVSKGQAGFKDRHPLGKLKRISKAPNEE